MEFNYSNISEQIPKEILSALESLRRDIEVDEYIDKGGNGHIFLGYHQIFKERIAIKFYYSGENFHKEVQLMSSISHKNILKVWDARTIDGGWAYFLTSELKNGDLDDYINNNRISLRKGLKIVRSILDGLSTMHSPPFFLVHRDLKPANILVNDKGYAKIADFGSIKRLPEDQPYVSGSNHASLYTPPESYERNIYNISSDLYQVGLVMYQILGGNLPYDPLKWFNNREMKKYKKLESDFEKSKFVDNVLYNRAKREKLIDLNTLPLYCDSKIKRILRKATRANYSRRYNTTAEFLYAIHNLGEIPDWKIKDNIIYIENYNNKDYRIMECKNGYVCKKNVGSGWRKEPKIKIGSKKEVVLKLMELFS